MKTIISAKWSNADRTAVTVQTVESAAVSVSLVDPPEYFDGWREAFDAWQADGNPITEFTPEE